MEPQQYNQINQPEEVGASAQGSIEQPTQPSAQFQPVFPQKKNYTKVIIVSFVAVIAVLAAAIIGFLVYSSTRTVSKIEPKTNSAAQSAPQSPVDASSKTLTQGTDTESMIMQTDDSNEAASAAASADNVGSSINENNF